MNNIIGEKHRNLRSGKVFTIVDISNVHKYIILKTGNGKVMYAITTINLVRNYEKIKV